VKSDGLAWTGVAGSGGDGARTAVRVRNDAWVMKGDPASSGDGYEPNGARSSAWTIVLAASAEAVSRGAPFWTAAPCLIEERASGRSFSGFDHFLVRGIVPAVHGGGVSPPSIKLSDIEAIRVGSAGPSNAGVANGNVTDSLIQHQRNPG